jgi:chaperone BCS1
MTTLSRELKAVTFDSINVPEPNSARDRQDERESDSSNVNGLFNFHAWYRKNPLIYKPNFNAKYFTHSGNLFNWCSNQRPSIVGGNLDRFIIIRCFGRSTKPIKDLLHEIKGFSLTNEHKTTEVYRSSLQSEGQWLRQSIKPSRPMCTVSLDEQQKAQIILDLNEYLQPLTARWYATRGIPYRRGYLFHGPPGTGKTSLSFALAGVFGLSIYCVSLSETGLTESHLATLFSNLPKRCVVLLEDIDAAGLRRDNHLADELGSYDQPSLRSRISSISLAGLLNIIDGAASHEVSILFAL